MKIAKNWSTFVFHVVLPLLIGLAVAQMFIVARQREEHDWQVFLQQCQADHPQYECWAMWRSTR